MSQTSVPIHSPAPAPDGPIACTLSPNDYAGRLDDFRHGVFNHLTEMQRPEPTRLRLTLNAGADPEAVAELLVREQGCFAFLSADVWKFVRGRSAAFRWWLVDRGRLPGSARPAGTSANELVGGAPITTNFYGGPLDRRGISVAWADTG